MMRSRFDDNDRIVHNDADGKYQSKERENVDREPKQRHDRKSANDGHWYRGRRYQYGSPVLQEHQDYEHQQASFDQCLVNFVNG